MSGKRYSPEEIVRKPRAADVLLGQGMKVPGVVRQLGVNKVTYCLYGRLTRCKTVLS